MKNKTETETETETETVTEEMLDEDLKEDELSDNEEPPPVVNEVETEEVQPSNVSNKYETIAYSTVIYNKYNNMWS